MKEIKLTQGKVVLVSDHRFEYLNQWKWHYTAGGYASRRLNGQVKYIGIYMHREIMQVGDGVEVDHIDGNKLNNVDENLRACTRAENSRNRRRHANNTSGYKGVSWSKREEKWCAKIRSPRGYLHIGFFVDLHEAARAYDTKALELYGPYAKTNF